MQLVKLSLAVKVLHGLGREMPLEAVNEVVIFLLESGPVGEITCSKADTKSFASISGANTSSSSADCRVSTSLLKLLFLGTICLDLDLRDKLCTGRNLKTTLIVDTVLIELGKLTEHGIDVNDDAISEDILAAWVENSAWKQVECILDTIGDDGVASVGSTIEASANVIVLGKDVDQFAFTFVTPLGAEDDSES